MNFVCLRRGPAGGRSAPRARRDLCEAGGAGIAAFAKLAAAFAVACAAAFSSSASARLDYRSQIYGGRRPAGEPLTLERWLASLKAERATTIERAIELFPENVRSNYLLMYRSRSLQKATFQRPRAILFEADGSFLAAFNGGEEGVPGGEAIETAQFRSDERRWEFREVTFEGGVAKASPANPPKCLQCHQSPARVGADPRPNWEPYFFWPGAYGSVDGDPSRKAVDSFDLMRRLRPSDGPMAEEQKREGAELAKFLEREKPTHPRYRLLGPFVSRTPVDFTQLLHWNNFRRVARLAAQTPRFALYRAALAELARCSGYLEAGDGAPRGLPPRIREMHLSAFAEISVRERFARGYGAGGRSDDRADENPTLTMRLHALFVPLGVDVSDWSMDFKSGGRFAFYERFGGPSDVRLPFQEAINEELPEFQGLSCDEMRERSHRAWAQAGEAVQDEILAEAKLAQARFEAPAQAPPLSRCARCHGDDGSGPPIPFDDEAALALRLHAGRYPRGNLMQEIEYRLGDLAAFDEQMPPTGMIRPSEREALVDYLRALAKAGATRAPSQDGGL